MDRRRVLVTGAGGFVGRHLLERLADGTRDLVALDLHPIAPEVLQACAAPPAVTEADITTSDLSAALDACHTVFHLAGYSSILETASEQARMERINVAGTRRVAAAAKHAGVRHFVFVSSVAACEEADVTDITEDNGRPRSTYGRTKKQAEAALLDMADDRFGVTILRPCALFGEHHRGSVFELALAIHQGRFLIIGDGSNRTNFYYIADFIDALLAVDHHPDAFGHVFIAGDTPLSQRALAEAVAAALGGRRRIRAVPRALGLAAGLGFDAVASLTGRPMPLSVRRVRAMTRDAAYSTRKLQRMIGVTPRVGVVDGLRRTIAWYRERGWL